MICEFKQNDARIEQKKVNFKRTFVTDSIEVWTSASFHFMSRSYTWISGEIVSLPADLWVHGVMPDNHQYGIMVIANYRFVVFMLISAACLFVSPSFASFSSFWSASTLCR